MRQVRLTRRLGPFAGILRLSPRYVPLDPDEDVHDLIEKTISEMTPEERQNPDVVDLDRCVEISRMSGVSHDYVRRFLLQFEVLREMSGAV